MKLRMTLTALVATMLLTACQTTGTEYTSPANGKPDKVAMDEADCEMVANQNQTTYGFGGLIGIAHYQETYNKQFDACMRSKGYQKKQ